MIQSLSEETILEILNDASDAFVFPMLDNGYIYPVASRLRAFRSETDWALVFETFGYSPRAGFPDLCLTAIGTGLPKTKTAADFVSREAFEAFEALNLYWRQKFHYPVEDDGWIDEANNERIGISASSLRVRGADVATPSIDKLTEIDALSGIGDPRHIANAMRALAETHREKLLASDSELDRLVPCEWRELLVLDEWCHPDISDEDVRPSDSETFRSLARTLARCEPSLYACQPPNTHWSNWPDGGSL